MNNIFILFPCTYKVSFSNMINLIFILLLICFNVFLIFNEINNPNEINNDKLQSGIIDNNLIKILSKIMVGTGSAYASYITVKDHHTNKEELRKQILNGVNIFEDKLELAQNQLAKSETENIQLKAKAEELRSTFGCFKQSFKKYINLTSQMEQLQKSQAETKTDQEKSKILSELNMVKTDRDAQQTEMERCFDKGTKNLDEIIYLNNEDQKSMIFDLDSVLEYYNSFHAVSRIALTLLLFNYVVISCLISIVFIFYGDYLIKRFDLENKYPTIYKIVSLRVKYQRYYLIMNMSLIFIILLLETLFCIIVINDFG
uniref:hypothetical protein n=1 Tax=Porodaedalea chrysoloma TaxID=74615 RepID=UPI0023AA841C|nr:hypothetical protein P1S03_mgp20 [Porodaedalea chrysoloma]WCF76786.1 hypothetical protein [Porodaedalea chrysoloma]